MLTGILPGAGGDLGRQQIHDQSVLVGRPYAAIAAQKAGAGAFLATEAVGTVEQAWRKPLETDRHFGQPTAQLIHAPVDHAAADQGLANGGRYRPIGAVR